MICEECGKPLDRLLAKVKLGLCQECRIIVGSAPDYEFRESVTQDEMKKLLSGLPCSLGERMKRFEPDFPFGHLAGLCASETRRIS